MMISCVTQFSMAIPRQPNAHMPNPNARQLTPHELKYVVA